MSRVYVNFIDHDEIKHLRKTEHERPIGRTEEAAEVEAAAQDGAPEEAAAQEPAEGTGAVDQG